MSSGQEPKPKIPHPLRVCGETQVKMEPEKKFPCSFLLPADLKTAPPEEEEEMI